MTQTDNARLRSMETNTYKIAVIYSVKESNWTSCRYITSNILEAYRLSYDNLIEFAHHNKYISCGEHIEIVNRIFEDEIEEVSFIDHMPRSFSVLAQIFLHANRNNLPLPKINIHIYGDYSLFGHLWNELNHQIFGERVRFICASERQSLLVASTLNSRNYLPGLLRHFGMDGYIEDPQIENGSDDFCDLLPFPVREDKFYFDKRLRQEFRSKHNIADDEYVLCYVGRISLQKNVLKVIEAFANSFQDMNGHCRLFLAGPIDDIALPFFSFSPPEGYYQSLLIDKIASLPPEMQEKIEYLGPLEQPEVLELFNGADCHLSFSLYHDEDYGMGVIEGLFTGITSIITDWGGYAGFEIDQPNLKYLPVTLNNDGIQIDFSPFKEFIQHFHKWHSSFAGEREHISKCYQDHFSVRAIAPRLRSLLKDVPAKKFPGFAHFIQKLHLKRKFDLTNIEQDLYGTIYKNYVRSEKDSRTRT